MDDLDSWSCPAQDVSWEQETGEEEADRPTKRVRLSVNWRQVATYASMVRFQEEWHDAAFTKYDSRSKKRSSWIRYRCKHWRKKGWAKCPALRRAEVDENGKVVLYSNGIEHQHRREGKVGERETLIKEGVADSLPAEKIRMKLRRPGISDILTSKQMSNKVSYLRRKNGIGQKLTWEAMQTWVEEHQGDGGLDTPVVLGYTIAQDGHFVVTLSTLRLVSLLPKSKDFCLHLDGMYKLTTGLSPFCCRASLMPTGVSTPYL